MSGGSEVLQELLVSLGYKVDGSSEKKFKTSIADMGELLAGLAAAAAAAAAAAVVAVARIAKSFEDLYWSSQRVHASVTNLRAFQYAFSQLGGSAGQAMSAVEGFASALRQNRGVESFVQQFGVTTRKTNGELRDATDTIEDFVGAIRKRYPNYDVAFRAAQVAGIDEGSFKLLWDHLDDLKKFKEEQKKAADAAGLDQDKAAKNLHEFMRQWTEFQMSLGAVATKIASDFAKPMADALKELQTWLNEHQDDIKSVLTQIGEAAAKAAEFIGKGGLTDAFAALGNAMQRVVDLARPFLDFLDKLNLGDMSGEGPAWLRFLDPGMADRLYGGKGRGGGSGGSSAAPATPDSGSSAPENRPWYKKAWDYVTGASAEGSGGSATNPEVVAYIRKAAEARGIDPSIALAVANSEGLRGYDPSKMTADKGGDAGTSFGPFQLHYKSDIPGYTLPGLGDAFTRATGLHASDPKTWREQIDFALDEAAKGGWTPWHGWRGPSRAGMGQGTKAVGRTPTQEASSGSGGTWDWIKDHIGLSANAAALTKQMDGTSLAPSSSSIANDNSKAVTLNQNTQIQVVGGTSPGDTAAEVVRHQSMVNAGLLRNTQGAVR